MNQDEKNKVRIDTFSGAVNGALLAGTGVSLVRSLFTKTAVNSVAHIAAGTLGRTAAAATLTTVVAPAVITTLTVGSVLYGAYSIYKAVNNN